MQPFGPQPTSARAEATTLEQRPGPCESRATGPPARDHLPTRRAAGLAPPRRVRCDLQQLTFSQRRPNATAAPGPGFGELPECLACVLMALSAASERLVRLIESRAQLSDGSAQEFELGALLIAQFDAPIPSLIGLTHRPVFAVRRHPPARRAPACSHSDRGPAHKAPPGFPEPQRRGRVRRSAREMVPRCRICSGSRRTGFLEALTPSSPSATSMASRLVNAASATVGKEPIGPPCPRNYRANAHS
jgi:hypothetical protein